MGPRSMLLRFNDIEAVRKNHNPWWVYMFKGVKIWSPQLVFDSRMVWINVYDIPLHVWDEPLFKKIGDLFGKFVDFDEDTIGRNKLDVARIKVETMRNGLVDDLLNLKVMGAVFSLWVVEEGGGVGWPPELREVVVEDAPSACSREGMGEDFGYFSDAEVEPREVDLIPDGATLGQYLMQGNKGPDGKGDVQVDGVEGC